MDTNVMYYYFEILRLGCDSCFIANLSVCVSTIYTLVGSILYYINFRVFKLTSIHCMQSWWRDGGDTTIESVFGKFGHRVWDAKEGCTLVFIVYQRSHFTLLVGLVHEKS